MIDFARSALECGASSHRFPKTNKPGSDFNPAPLTVPVRDAKERTKMFVLKDERLYLVPPAYQNPRRRKINRD